MYKYTVHGKKFRRRAKLIFYFALKMPKVEANVEAY
jgi:hypothetical protein